MSPPARLARMDAAAFLQRHRRLVIGIACTLGLLLLAALLVLSFGWTLLRKPLEQRLSQQLGRPVRIGTLTRTDHGFLHPVLHFGDVHVAQPGWVGGGDMVVVRSADIRLPLLPLLVGQARPSAVEIDGLSIALVRRDATFANWKGFPAGGSGGGDTLRHVVIRHGTLSLDDRKRDHRFFASIAADGDGLRVRGKGSLTGHPSSLALTGGPLGTAGAWPFRFDYRSAIASGTLLGRADHPLDLGHFTARANAWGDDLRHLDLLIEAGLPGTQPVRLTADLRHDRPGWQVRNLDLHLGRSHVTGALAIDKDDDRTKLDGDIASSGLDFDDLASDEGLAKAAAKRRRYGPRLIPDTAIHLEHLRRTDGTIRFDVRHLLSDAPTQVRRIRGTLTLDHGVLTARPLTVTLAKGQVAGMARVRHPSGTPLLTLDLRVTGADLSSLAGDAASGALAAHVRLEGHGSTVRAAVGTASGVIGVVGRNGAINRRAALFLGSDAGRALFEDKSDTTALRCLIGRFVVHDGVARPAPLVLDTAVSRTQGTGTVDLSQEKLDLILKGRPKLAKAVRLDLSIQLGGTFSNPEVVPQNVSRTVGTALKLIGRAIGGDHAAPAPDADCPALAAQTLR